MTMFMCIVIYMNIYLTSQNESRLHDMQGYTMSGLINHLLNKWFDEHTPEQIKKLEKMTDELAAKHPEAAKDMNSYVEMGNKAPDAPKPLKVIKKKDDVPKVLSSIKNKSESKDCPNGHPADWRGKCFDKKCKYSK